MFTRGLVPRSWSESDWLSTKVDKLVTQCQGYTKLRSRRLSKGCQTMLDRPSPLWAFQEPSVSRSDQTNNNPNVNISSLTLGESNVNEDSNRSNRQMNFYQKQLQYDQDIANYIAYLNKPVINMNDHYIEIHQYHYEPSNLPQGVPVRPPTRRKKHRIDVRKTEVVENKSMNTVRPMSPEYSEFLVKKETDLNRNIRVVCGRSSDEENKKPEEDDLDFHRPLTQRPPSGADKMVDTVIDKDGLVKVKRNQTFSARSTLSADDSHRFQASLQGFMSFRTARKNKSGRRKKVVVGEKGLDGPIWPAVLLTFDRSVTPTPQETSGPNESQV